jgi:hypothetical protein
MAIRVGENECRVVVAMRQETHEDMRVFGAKLYDL